MPHLQLFAPCERAIIEQGSNAASLIGIFQNIRLPAPPSGVPSNTLALQRWAVVTSWVIEIGDQQRRFQQLVTLVNPESREILRSQTDFEFTKRSHRIVTMMTGLPMAPVGEYRLQLSLRELGATEWRSVSSYFLLLEYVSTRASVSPSPSPSPSSHQ